MLAQYKNSETLTIVCRYTGIQAKIDLPKIGHLTLEYTHPLSHIDSALEASNRQDFMRRLDAPVLAGILITLLRHTKLLAASKDHAGAINAQLSKASKAHLIKSIEVIRRNILTLDKTYFLPKITFDYYESTNEANRALEAAIGTLVSEVLSDDSVLDQVRNYFRAHTKATTFDGYTRELAMARAAEIEEIKREAKAAELERKASEALRKAEQERKAKEGMLTKRERAQKLRLIVRTKTKLTAKQTAVLTNACKQAEILPEHQLTKLQGRVTELLDEHDCEETRDVLLAAQSIFTHYLKAIAQSPFSVEDELLGRTSVHGEAEETKEDEWQPEIDASVEATKKVSETKQAAAKKHSSLLERIRAKRSTETSQ